MQEPIKLTKEMKILFLEILRSGVIMPDQAAKVMDLMNCPQLKLYMDGKPLYLQNQRKEQGRY